LLTISILLSAMSVTDLRSLQVPLKLSLSLMAYGAYLALHSFDLDQIGIKVLITVSLVLLAYIPYRKNNIIWLGGADVLVLVGLLFAVELKSWLILCYVAIILAGVVGVILRLLNRDIVYLPFVPFITGAFWGCYIWGALQI